MEVLEISLEDSTVRVNSPIISSGCSGRGANISINMTGSPFSFSSSNIFIAMGCNNRALLNGLVPEIVGCTSTCGANNLTSSSTEGKENSYCSGNNCCQTRIPSSLQVFSASLGNAEQGSNRCKVAFIVERAWFRNNISSRQEVLHRQYVPVIVDWFVYYGTDIPEGVTLYSNARYCIPISSGGLGLRTETLYSNSTICMCNDDYDGNPYLPDGCTDIDECKIPSGKFVFGDDKMCECAGAVQVRA